MTPRLDVLFAAEAGLAHPGGAERFALELLGALSARHRTRALVLGEPGPVAAWERLADGPQVHRVGPPDDGDAGPWRRRRLRMERTAAAVDEALAEDPPDVVVGQLYAGGGAVGAAQAAGVPSVVLLAGYEALCHWAFVRHRDTCVPRSRCRACPGALALDAAERGELWRVRAEHDAALARADLLVAPSRTVADACYHLIGRRPHVAAPVTRAPRPAAARPGGHVLLAASVWDAHKGSELLAPIARRLAHRRFVVLAPNGMPAPARQALFELAHVEVRETALIDGALDGAALLLVPSQIAEPFGRLAFEGLAAGIPTLASATGGMAEFVPAAQQVSSFDDPDAWAGAVRGLEDELAWREAGQRGREAAAAVLRTDPAGGIERRLLALAPAQRLARTKAS